MPIETIEINGESIEFNYIDEADLQRQAQQAASFLQTGGQDVPIGSGDLVNNGEPDSSFLGAGIIEPLATAASAVIAEPLAGIAGTFQAVFSGEDGAGARAVEEVRKSLTFQPRTPEGKAALEETAEFFKPVGVAIQDAERFLGDSVFDLTGSPALAAASATLPTAFLEILGLKGGGRLARGKSGKPSKKQIAATLKEAAPEPEVLKNISRAVYKEIDDAGVTLKPRVFDGMIAKIEKATKGVGLSPLTTPKASGVIQEFKNARGQAINLTEVDNLRKIAQGVARNIDPTESAIGARIIDEVDDFLDNISPKALESGNIPAKEIGKKYKVARQLWGRARKSELIQDAISSADLTASGFENGLRIEIGKIIKSKKKSKFFNAGEIATMRQLVKGDFPQNFAKLVGKLGFSEGRATNLIGGSVGSAGGLAAGGLAGAVLVPAAGTVAKKISTRLTKGKVDFTDALVRSGNNGEKIVEAYMTAVPKGSRKISEITDLLSDPSVDLTELIASADKRLNNIAEIAAGKQTIGEISGVVTATDFLLNGAGDPLEDIPQEAIDLLKSDPSQAQQFDATFGRSGLAREALAR